MKIVELKINDSIISGFDALALVESPAIEEDFVAFNKVSMAEMTYNDYPQAAVDAAKRGIELNKKYNNKCATQVGKVRAQQLVNGEKLSLDTIQRMRSFLIRQKGNYELATRRKDYSACGYISYLLWGGESALPWAEKKLRQAGIEFSKFATEGEDVYLISCSSEKKDFKCSAEEMYDSALFEKSLSFARKQQSDDDYIKILSAKYYLTDLDQMIAPYDLTLKNFSVQQKKDWANKVYSQILDKYSLQYDRFMFLAGQAYTEYLMSKFKYKTDILEGKRIGERMEYLDKFYVVTNNDDYAIKHNFAVINNEGLLETEYAEVGPRGGIKASPKAPKSDTPNPNPKGRGSAKGDASTTRGADVDKATEETLQKKADEFNEKYKDKLGYGVNVGMLKSVYQRGLGAYNTSRSPAVAAGGGAKQWALARVNAFLYLVKEGRPQNKKYTTDYDLLPTKHPKRENFNEDILEEIIKDSLNINVFGYPTEYFYMCPGAKATFEHLVSMEMDEDTKGMVRSAAQIADNIFDLEEDVIENGIATPDDVELASLLISDFKDLMSEIDEIVGMTHDVSYMDGHLKTIVELAPEAFNINVNALPNYVNEASVGKKRNFAAELAEKQMLVGPLMTPGKLIPRKDDDTGEEYQVFFSADTIEKIAYKMMQDKLVDSVNIEHDGAHRVDDAYLVETWIVKDPEADKSVLYGFQPIKGQWFGIYKIDNGRVWNEYVKTGKVKGFSVEGYFYNNVLTNK